MSNQVRVIDSLSHTTLFLTTIEKIADAYAFATQMEEAGLDVEIVAPGLAETLIQSLGAEKEEIEEYKKSLEEEIEDHENPLANEKSCAFCPPEK